MRAQPKFNSGLQSKQYSIGANQTNERGYLAQSIAASQEKLGVRRDVRLREDEMLKCTVKFLVKFDALLRELVMRGEP